MKKYFLIITLIFFSLGADALVVGNLCGKYNSACDTVNLEGQNEQKCYCKYTQETTTYTCGKGFQLDSSTNKCTPTSTKETITNGHVVYKGKAECDPSANTEQQTCYRSEKCDTDCGGGVMSMTCRAGGFTPL